MENDKNPIPPSPGGVASVADAGKQALERAGVSPGAASAGAPASRRGPGRPRKFPLPGAAVAPPLGAPAIAPVAPPPPPIDLELVRTSVVGLLVVIDGVAVRRITKRAVTVGKLSQAEAAALGEDCALRPEESEMIARLSAALCQKYGILGQYAPEVLLLGVIAGYTGRLFWAGKRIDESAPKKENAQIELAPQKLKGSDNGEKRDGKD